MRSLLRVGVLLGWVPVFVSVCPVRAQETYSSAPSLNWVRLAGAEQCIGPSELAQRVESRLGRDVFVSSATAQLAVEGHIGPGKHGGWQARLAVSDDTGQVLGERILDSDAEDCTQLDEALVLVIAVTIYPQSGLAISAIPLPENVTAELDRLFQDQVTEVVASPPVVAASSLSMPPRGSSRPAGTVRSSSGQIQDDEVSSTKMKYEWGWRLAASSGVGWGITPATTFGLGLLFSIKPYNIWPLELRANYWFGNTITEKDADLDTGIAQVKTSLLSVNLGACPADLDFDPLRLMICGGVEVDTMFTSSTGFRENDVESPSPLPGIYAGFELNLLVIDPFALHLGGILNFPLVRSVLTYRVRDETTFFDQQAVTARIELGLGANLF